MPAMTKGAKGMSATTLAFNCELAAADASDTTVALFASAGDRNGDTGRGAHAKATSPPSCDALVPPAAVPLLTSCTPAMNSVMLPLVGCGASTSALDDVAPGGSTRDGHKGDPGHTVALSYASCSAFPTATRTSAGAPDPRAS